MIQDSTSVFPKAFTELAFGLSDVLKVAPFTLYQVYKIFGMARYGVRAKVSGMCDFPNSSYSAKGFSENYRVKYGDAMLEPVGGTPTWVQRGDKKPVETSGVYFGSLKTFSLSVKLENIHIGTSLDILVTQNSKI